MKKILFPLFLSALGFSTLTLSSCSEHVEDDQDPPVVFIHTPTANAVISGAVNITGDISDASLHEMNIAVTRDADGSTLFTGPARSIHSLHTYEINEIWTPSVTTETPVTLTVTVEDHSGHTTTETVKFSIGF